MSANTRVFDQIEFQSGTAFRTTIKMLQTQSRSTVIHHGVDFANAANGGFREAAALHDRGWLNGRTGPVTSQTRTIAPDFAKRAFCA